MRGICVRSSNLLVLFDAENMPIQTYYREVEAIVIEAFSETMWKNAILETAYKERTEGYNNKGYNDLIHTHYVGYGKDKADDKLIEIATQNSELEMVIVTNDKLLIQRLQEVAHSTVLICNSKRIQEHVLETLQERRSLKSSLEKDKKVHYEAYLKADYAIKNINKKINERKRLLKQIKKDNPYVDKMKSKEADTPKHGMLENFFQSVEPSYVKTHIKLRELSLVVIENLYECPKIKERLEHDGLDVSVIKAAVEYAVIDFSMSYFGFVKFIDFVRFFIQRSRLKLVVKEETIYRLISREHQLEGFVEVEEFDDTEIVETIESIADVYLEKQVPSSMDMDFLEGLKKSLK